MILVWCREKIPIWIGLFQGFFDFENLVKAVDLLFPNLIEMHSILHIVSGSYWVLQTWGHLLQVKSSYLCHVPPCGVEVSYRLQNLLELSFSQDLGFHLGSASYLLCKVRQVKKHLWALVSYTMWNSLPEKDLDHIKALDPKPGT